MYNLINNLFTFIGGLFLPTCAIISLYFSIRNIKKIRNRNQEEKIKGTVVKLVCSILICLLSIFTMLCIYLFVKFCILQYTPLSWVKKDFTEEEMNIICKELKLNPTEQYQIISARYESGEELSVYLHVDDEAAENLKGTYGDMMLYSQDKLKEYVNRTNGVVGFFKEVCGYPEEYLETELKWLGNLNTPKKGYYQEYTNMFGEQQICITVYPYNEQEYGLCTYVWKEQEGYGIEVAREQGIFYTTTEHELYEIFSGEE